jgi:DNA-binding CsgD family transcriptional regulator
MMNEDIAAKLDTLIRLQATSMVEKYETQKERISFLNKAGLPPKEIGSILGVSPNSVSVTLSGIRKKEKQDGG